MWLCVSFFAEGKIKDIVNSAEDVLNEFPVLSLVIAITQKTKFVANANNFWVSSSVKILAHTTECILVETNSLKKNWAECTQESRGWRRPGGSSAAELCQVVRSVPALLFSLHSATLQLRCLSGLFRLLFQLYVSRWRGL